MCSAVGWSRSEERESDYQLGAGPSRLGVRWRLSLQVFHERHSTSQSTLLAPKWRTGKSFTSGHSLILPSLSLSLVLFSAPEWTGPCPPNRNSIRKERWRTDCFSCTWSIPPSLSLLSVSCRFTSFQNEFDRIPVDQCAILDVPSLDLKDNRENQVSYPSV